jgi:VacB/RNase II family 3'-5' exoribonuclease
MNDSPRAARGRLHEIARRAMIARGMQPDFSPAALEQARTIAEGATERAPAIRDLRERLWCSIDNDDSRDLDQLSVAEPGANGTTKILVAIADVDALVARGTPIDDHARTNTTSIYTAGGMFPMLPERLSTDLTSLNAERERLAVVVELDVSADGEVGATDAYRALVFNHAKLAYDSVAAWLEGEAPAPAPLAAVPGLEAQLRLQDRVAQALRSVRFRRGALRLDTREPRAVFDGDTLIDMRSDERNRAKELIEDFMIAANTATIAVLERNKFPSLRRILRSPERWNRIVQLADELGERLPLAPSASALEAFLEKQSRVNAERFPDISLAVVKLLGSGEYAAQTRSGGTSEHFGLAIRDYTHSTAPNRRFPDLITQRLLKAAIAKRPIPYSDGELVALARHCSEQEDDATKIERHVRKSAEALLLSDRIGQRFDGIVTGASEKGTWARIFRPAAEGKIVHGWDDLDVGDRVRVELVATDVERGFIDFVRVRD